MECPLEILPLANPFQMDIIPAVDNGTAIVEPLQLLESCIYGPLMGHKIRILHPKRYQDPLLMKQLLTYHGGCKILDCV